MQPRTPEAFAPGTPGQPDCVLDAEAWAPPGLVADLRGECVAGEVVRLYAPDVTPATPYPPGAPRYPIYPAPKQDHVFVIGAPPR